MYNPQKESDKYVAAVYIRYDKAYDSYSRKIYSILDWLGDIGGFKETVIIFGEILCGMVVERMFFAKIMKNIYHTRKFKDDPTFFNLDELEEMKKKRAKCCRKKKHDNLSKVHISNSHPNSLEVIPSGLVPPGHMRHPSDSEKAFVGVSSKRGPLNFEPTGAGENENENEEVDADEEQQRENEEAKQTEFKQKHQVSIHDIQSLLMAFVLRRRFYYKLVDILKYYFCCFCIRRVEKFRSKKAYKNHYLYDKGEEKLKMELDVINLIKIMRKSKLL